MSDGVHERRKLLIVGAGIAGCAVGISAENLGNDVTLVESRSREDIVENGRTSFEALQNLTSRGDAIGYLSNLGLKIGSSYPYKGAIIKGPSGASIDLRLNRLHGYSMRRNGKDSLDHQMIEKVERSGIEIEFSTRFIKMKGNGEVKIRNTDGDRQIKPDLIIGADGLGSSVARGISHPMRKEEIAIGVGYHFEGDHSFEPGIAQCWLGSSISPGEYAYILPTDGEMTLVVTMRPHLMDSGSKPMDYLKRFMAIPSIREGLEGTRIVNKVTGGVPVTSGGPLGAGNTLLVGEAARLTDPMLGFGMINSIVSGHLAGSYSSSPDPLRFYCGAVKETISRDLRSRARARNRIIDKVKDGTIDELLVIADKVLTKVDPDRSTLIILCLLSWTVSARNSVRQLENDLGISCYKLLKHAK